MKHRSLMAPAIRSVASNELHVSCAKDAIHDVCTVLLVEANRHYERGRRITPNAMKALHKTCDDIILEKLQVVDYRVRETLPTAARPKSGSIDASYVGVRKKECVGYPDLYELFSLRIVIKPKNVTIHLHPHPITFLYHAAERVVGRLDGQTLPFEMIAGELADWSLALWHIFRLTDGDRDKAPLGLPCMEGKGMLAGRFVEMPISPIRRVTAHKLGRSGDSAEPDEEVLPVFVVKTFVDRDRLHLSQVAALNRLARWRLLNKAEYMDARDALLWDVAFHNEGYDIPMLSDAPMAELKGILEDPDFKRAMMHRTYEADASLGRAVQSEGIVNSASKPWNGKAKGLRGFASYLVEPTLKGIGLSS